MTATHAHKRLLEASRRVTIAAAPSTQPHTPTSVIPYYIIVTASWLITLIVGGTP